MASDSINIFASKEYALLNWLSEHQSKTSDGPVVKFSQNDLAQEYRCSLVTINKRMQALCKSGCLESYKKRGNYRVTEKGRAVIARMHEIDNLFGGTENGK